ncbi:MAG: hypothetical protein E6J90_09810 [Deltaproteobacteria bacterium]|nr:MAG: hypothetical protein E6J91_02575 [Deltaproteobacteria bacterium]TMQ23773.1 MAG: hypothetical protein E6J90_09810 [Deltaproteobacteria bacterium]
MTLYNPHLLARQELIDTFVARQPLLDELVDSIRRGGGGHHLLIGDRGSGKTTLLLRLATALEDDPQLARQCIPLRFPEEQYNVSRPSDFWMNAIDALIDALERQNDRAAVKHLESSLTEIDPLEEDERARQSLAVLEGWVKQARRLVVLLIDNLDLVLDRLADSLWDLRETLSTDNGLVLIGASSKFIAEAIDYQAPFYDFFHVHELGPLSEDEARRIVLSLAQRANTPRVAEVLERDPGRFKALYLLTGGTPRTLALLHTVLALDPSDRVERDLEGLLDQLTPYYKARFDDLPPQSQVVVDKVALHWHPITAAECQKATRLDLNVVSAQLSRLVKSGVLAKVALPGSKLGFQLSERFFNIWYLMRASRRLRRKLSWFVEFLRIFYGEEDLRRRAEELVRAAPAGSVDSPAKLLAFASAIPDEALRRQLEFRAVGLLAEEGLTAIREAIDLEGEDMHLAPVIDRVRALRDIRARIVSANVRWPAGVTPHAVAEDLIRHPMFSIELKDQRSRFLVQSTVDPPRGGLAAWGEPLLEVGERLLRAIASGEAPSLADVRTFEEVRQIIELADSPSNAILMLIAATEANSRPLPDEVIRQLLQLVPQAVDHIVVVAAALIHSDWARARHLVLLVRRQTTRRIHLVPLLAFLHKCVAENRAREALDLLLEADIAERWSPLYEALRAVVEGSKAWLDALAPEIRTVALDLHDQLCSPGASPDVHVPRKSAHRTSEARRKASEMIAASRSPAQHKPGQRRLSKPGKR